MLRLAVACCVQDSGMATHCDQLLEGLVSGLLGLLELVSLCTCDLHGQKNSHLSMRRRMLEARIVSAFACPPTCASILDCKAARASSEVSATPGMSMSWQAASKPHRACIQR